MKHTIKPLAAVCLSTLPSAGVCLALLALSTGLQAAPPSAIVTQGEFVTYASGVERGYDISGHTTLVRVPSGKTIVTTHASGYGLYPDTQYGSHVHNKACSDANGGGHYQDEVGAAVNDSNEIWPLLIVNAGGVGKGYAKNDFIAREDAQSVVIHDTDGARIACADLH